MRVAYVVLVLTLLVSTKAEPASVDSIDKKTFTITSPESNDTLDGVYVQSGGEKFLILHLEDEAKQIGLTQATKVGDDDSTSNKGDSASDGQEERAGVSLGTVKSLKKQFSGEYNTFWNKLWWRFFHNFKKAQKADPLGLRFPPRAIPSRPKFD